MRTVRRYSGLTEEERGASAAIGNFDGVHRGHQAVLDMARAEATRLGCPTGAVTFEPHPRQFFGPDGPAFRLMNAEARAHRLEKLGIEHLYELPFDAALAALSAEAFAKEALADGLGLRHVVVGADFRFGKGRAGTAETLRRIGPQLGFGVSVAGLLEDPDAAEAISSTRIRTALSAGRPGDAREMLGHWHRIEGPVLHGEKRGHALGYPTANMSLDGLHLPRFGVYAVLVDILGGSAAGEYTGVASLGVRPMFGGEVANLETHIFDFAGDLYGTHLSVALVAFLRPEASFDGVPALIKQMDADSAAARGILSARA